ncbi:membrane protein [Kitasatospora phosalacinea]|uniref:Membrane protein n=1 Tax=Kitasatospora phosalacinea TaxID=2065 RepID=A0A9W6V594_9ACTN|nr:DUF2510 domain-containing protein [Kitasatospora phosalacinea]GLW73007.1 membrane protein [Kitasatospora phosalacinea]
MSNPTPPGWYPVPGTGQERWWDGTAWTDSHRQAGLVNDAVTQTWQVAPGPPPPAPPSFGPPGPPPGRPGRGPLIAVVSVVVVLLAGAVGTVLWALQPDGPKKAGPAPTITVGVSTPAASRPPRSPSPTPDATETDDTSADDTRTSPAPALQLADKAHGWGVPLPDGWTAEPANERATVVEISGQYACEQSESLCLRGQFAIAADSVDAADAQAAAEQAMTDFAAAAFGTLRSHREESAGTLTVAGHEGWAIRWHVEPEQGAAGYAVVAAVPDPDGSGYVILRGGVDDDPKAPDPAVLDDIIQGITTAS